jgi:glucan phosphorylase
MTSEELHADVQAKRLARYQRRQQRIMREEARERALRPVKRAFEVVAGGVILYAILLLGVLWAAM